MHDNKEILKWLNNLLKTNIQENVFDALQDGSVLCQLYNTIVKKDEIKIEQPKNNFGKMQNVNRFIKAIEKLGVPNQDLFTSVDIVEKKNLKQVEICLYSLSRVAFQKGMIKDNDLLGPKLCEKKEKTVFKNNESPIPRTSMGIVYDSLGTTLSNMDREISGKVFHNMDEKK